MQVFGYGAMTDGQCGIGRFYSFVDCSHMRLSEKKYYEEGFADFSKKLTMENHRGGTGLFGTGFIDNDKCKAAYEQICQNHRLVFQTPVRVNQNSLKKFFYAMWDDDENDDIESIQPEWPF